ncbi:MAG TPA: purine-nucleoside phosphorylase [Thermoanaerobaculia bacterium]|nr:purine-nucleoside phosphorylase [Thermoanaerobaculia bacterium]
MDDIDPLSRQLSAAVALWRSRNWPVGDVLLVGGSGLSVDLGEPIWGPTDLADVLPFASDAIVGHALSIEAMRAPSGGHVLFQRGRLHAYQGYSPAQVVFTVRLARLLGAHTLVVTNAAGGIYENARPGDLALICDHINFTGLNPLRGALPPEWGPRFPDLSCAYDADLRRRAREVAAAQGLELREGVYAGLLGPSYETPAEVEALRRLGGDLVGMSTVLEVIAARHMGMRCLGLSLVTNPAAGSPTGTLDHDDVLEVSLAVSDAVQKFLAALLDEAVVPGS